MAKVAAQRAEAEALDQEIKAKLAKVGFGVCVIGRKSI